MSENTTSPNPSYVERQNSVTAEWSRKRLELAPGDKASTHQQVCDYLKSCQFRPSGLNRTAVIGSIHPDRALRSTSFRELMTREMLSQFSSEFFELPRNLREQQLEQFLENVVEFPQIKWRLNRLKQGVSISSPVPRGSDENSMLASTMAEMFVMSPESAARVGRAKTIDIGGQKSAARHKEHALRVTAKTYPDFTKLEPPDGSSIVRRLDRMAARAKHLRPVRDYGKISFLVIVIGIAFLRIAMLPRIGGGGSYRTPSFQTPSFQMSPGQNRQTFESVLDRSKSDISAKAKQRLVDAEKRMEEIREQSRSFFRKPDSDNETQPFDSSRWQEAYEQIQIPSSDLPKYVDDQKDRTDQLLKPSKSPGYVPGSALPGFQSPGSPDPAKDVDQFLESLKNEQRGRSTP